MNIITIFKVIVMIAALVLTSMFLYFSFVLNHDEFVLSGFFMMPADYLLFSSLFGKKE